ncbi:MAG: efflux transporter outer membrane subunit [Rhodospirillales bacterium]|nr:efflux transporter outer membrane subunit [Rhodospirillales bacterium]
MVACLWLTGCSVGPDYKPESPKFQDSWISGRPEQVTEEAVRVDWWRIFDDPLLNSYIERAASENKDVKVAMANVSKARALRRAESAGFLPQISASAQGNRSDSSDRLSLSTGGSAKPRNVFGIAGDASWELDLFGGTRRAVEAADARLEGAQASYQAAMLATLAEVARSYYTARGLQKRVAITENNAELLNQTFTLIEARHNAGEASEFDLSRARGEYDLTLARIPNLRAELDASVFALSVLLGLPPEALQEEMQDVKPLPAPPDLVPVGLRSDILRRRPDVKIAERELAASVADIGVQTAELFPKFFITGDAGSQARVFGDLFSAGSGVWSFGSLVQWPLFQGGAIRGQIEARKAESAAALASYEKTVLGALSDAETALTRYGRELETRKRLSKGVQSRRKSVELAKALYEAGEEDYLSVLDAERELTASEDDLVVSETSSITKLVTLYAALGGGWEFHEATD